VVKTVHCGSIPGLGVVVFFGGFTVTKSVARISEMQENGVEKKPGQQFPNIIFNKI